MLLTQKQQGIVIIPMNIGERIRALRRANKHTQGQLAVAVGRTQQEIYKWEKGTIIYPTDELLISARSLCTTTFVLWVVLENSNMAKPASAL